MWCRWLRPPERTGASRYTLRKRLFARFVGSEAWHGTVAFASTLRTERKFAFLGRQVRLNKLLNCFVLFIIKAVTNPLGGTAKKQPHKAVAFLWCRWLRPPERTGASRYTLRKRFFARFVGSEARHETVAFASTLRTERKSPFLGCRVRLNKLFNCFVLFIIKVVTNPLGGTAKKTTA